MSDNIDNIIVEHLKALRNEIKEFRSRYDQDTADFRQRFNTLERGQAGLKHEAAGQFEGYVSQQVIMDKIQERIEKIEKRLELGNH